jgi:hypothetical protein
MRLVDPAPLPQLRCNELRQCRAEEDHETRCCDGSRGKSRINQGARHCFESEKLLEHEWAAKVQLTYVRHNLCQTAAKSIGAVAAFRPFLPPRLIERKERIIALPCRRQVRAIAGVTTAKSVLILVFP